MDAQQNTSVQPTIVMPSADLINYRFDQTDKNIGKLNTKLDNLTNKFVTKEEAVEINRRLDNYTWYWRAVFLALLSLLGGVVMALIQKK